MRILYGVAGEGIGHATYALEIGKFLEAEGHELLLLTYDQVYYILREKFNTRNVFGMHAIYNEGRVRRIRTAAFNTKNFIKDFGKTRRLWKELKRFNPDIVITDMEFISSYFGYLNKIPTLAVGNIPVVMRCKIDVPEKYKKDYFTTKLVIKLFNPKINDFLIFSLDKKIPFGNNYFSKPVLREEMENIKSGKKDYIVVYLSKKNDSLLKELRKIKEKFYVFEYNVEKDEGNLSFRRREDYLNYFANCKAIISNAGFNSIIESLFLNKPILCVPLRGQFEQMFNALQIEKKGLGKYVESINEKNLRDFLDNLESHEINQSKYNVDLPEATVVLKKLLEKYGAKGTLK